MVIDIGTTGLPLVRVLQRHITCDDLVITGGARGADSMAYGIGRKQIGCEVKVFLPDWGRYGKAAGPIRNRQMLAERPDFVLAFHKNFSRSKGTRDCIDQATKLGINCILIDGKEK